MLESALSEVPVTMSFDILAIGRVLSPKMVSWKASPGVLPSSRGARWKQIMVYVDYGRRVIPAMNTCFMMGLSFDTNVITFETGRTMKVC